MTYKEFLAWLEGYLAAVGPNQVSPVAVSAIITKARSVKIEPNLSEQVSDKIKQMLHD